MSACWGAMTYGKGRSLLVTIAVQYSNCGEGYDASNQTAYLDDMLRWGLDWLIKVDTQFIVFLVATQDLYGL